MRYLDYMKQVLSHIIVPSAIERAGTEMNYSIHVISNRIHISPSSTDIGNEEMVPRYIDVLLCKYMLISCKFLNSSLMVPISSDSRLQLFVPLNSVLRFCSLPKIGGFTYQDRRYHFSGSISCMLIDSGTISYFAVC